MNWCLRLLTAAISCQGAPALHSVICRYHGRCRKLYPGCRLVGNKLEN